MHSCPPHTSGYYFGPPTGGRHSSTRSVHQPDGEGRLHRWRLADGIGDWAWGASTRFSHSTRSGANSPTSAGPPCQQAMAVSVLSPSQDDSFCPPPLTSLPQARTASWSSLHEANAKDDPSGIPRLSQPRPDPCPQLDGTPPTYSCFLWSVYKDAEGYPPLPAQAVFGIQGSAGSPFSSSWCSHIAAVHFQIPQTFRAPGGSAQVAELLTTQASSGTVYSDCLSAMRKITRRWSSDRSFHDAGAASSRTFLTDTLTILWIKGHPERSDTPPSAWYRNSGASISQTLSPRTGTSAHFPTPQSQRYGSIPLPSTTSSQRQFPLMQYKPTVTTRGPCGAPYRYGLPLTSRWGRQLGTLVLNLAEADARSPYFLGSPLACRKQGSRSSIRRSADKCVLQYVTACTKHMFSATAPAQRTPGQEAA